MNLKLGPFGSGKPKLWCEGFLGASSMFQMKLDPVKNGWNMTLGMKVEVVGRRCKELQFVYLEIKNPTSILLLFLFGWEYFEMLFFVIMIQL